MTAEQENEEGNSRRFNESQRMKCISCHTVRNDIKGNECEDFYRFENKIHLASFGRLFKRDFHVDRRSCQDKITASRGRWSDWMEADGRSYDLSNQFPVSCFFFRTQHVDVVNDDPN